MKFSPQQLRPSDLQDHQNHLQDHQNHTYKEPPQGGAAYWEGSDGPGGGSGGPGAHWASSAIGNISNTPVSEAGSIFPGTPNRSSYFFVFDSQPIPRPGQKKNLYKLDMPEPTVRVPEAEHNQKPPKISPKLPMLRKTPPPKK